MARTVIRSSLAALAGVALLATLALAVWLNPAADKSAQANHALSIGIDTNTTGNSALSLGATQEACRVVSQGLIFDVDLYVRGVDDLLSWEAYIVYNKDVLIITKPGDNAQNNNALFLLQQAQPDPPAGPSNNLQNTSETLPDTLTPGIYRVGAADLAITSSANADPHPEIAIPGDRHADGVLVRLQVQAIAVGFSTLNISPFSTEAGAVGPFLKDGDGIVIGNTDGDPFGIFDGPIVNGQIVVGSGSCTDSDGDGVPDSSDNCPTIANPTQANFDGDAQGDACDLDDDNDGLLDTSEPATCGSPPHPGSLDPDCDDDNVSDGPLDPDGAGPIIAGPDNCISVANSSQTNTDGDAQGDACDPDDDNDTVLDGADNCPLTANALQTNTDGDALGDACDPEDDGDGYLDTAEANVGSDPLDNCGNPTTTAPIYSRAFPADLVSSGMSANKVDVQDLASYIAPVRRMNTSLGDAGYHVRWDLVPGGAPLPKTINIQDLTSLVIVAPLMFNNVRAFNHAPCTP